MTPITDELSFHTVLSTLTEDSLVRVMPKWGEKDAPGWLFAGTCAATATILTNRELPDGTPATPGYVSTQSMRSGLITIEHGSLAEYVERAKARDYGVEWCSGCRAYLHEHKGVRPRR